jgi:hypothetical protein
MSAAVLYSGGVCSHLAAKRWIADNGSCVLLFSDTGIEDPDLYRFIKEASVSIGGELVTVASGETFDQMVKRNGALPSQRMPFCSRELKVMPAKRWLDEHPEVDTLVVGIDWIESHRLPRVQSRWPKYTVTAPMMDAPYLTKRQMLDEIRADGVEPPRLYALGFQHNNCGGGCVRAGHTAWRHLARTLPDVFETWVQREALIPGHSFNKDRRGGVAKPFPLTQIASEMEPTIPDWGGCGCFVDEDES